MYATAQTLRLHNAVPNADIDQVANFMYMHPATWYQRVIAASQSTPYSSVLSSRPGAPQKYHFSVFNHDDLMGTWNVYQFC